MMEISVLSYMFRMFPIKNVTIKKETAQHPLWQVLCWRLGGAGVGKALQGRGGRFSLEK